MLGVRSLFGRRSFQVSLRLALVGPLLLAAIGGPQSALGAPGPSPMARAAAATPTLGDLVVPLDQLGPGWTQGDQQQPGDGVIRVTYVDPLDFAAPRQATFWVKVAPSRDGALSPIAAARQLIGGTTPTLTPVDLGDSPDAVKAVGDAADGAAVVAYAFVVDRASGVVSLQGDASEQDDLSDQALAFAGLQVDRLRSGLPEVEPGGASTPQPAAPPATPQPQAAPAAGSILLADNFDDPSRGMLPQVSPEPQHFTRGYENGEYVMRVVDATWGADYFAIVTLPGSYADATLSVDARIANANDNGVSRAVVVDCRVQSGAAGFYRFYASPSDGAVALSRRDANNWISLVEWQPAPAIHKGTEWNKIELTCSGRRIAAAINGTTVLTVQDSTYKKGSWGLLTGTGATGRTETHFNNLILTATSGS